MPRIKEWRLMYDGRPTKKPGVAAPVLKAWVRENGDQLRIEKMHRRNNKGTAVYPRRVPRGSPHWALLLNGSIMLAYETREEAEEASVRFMEHHNDETAEPYSGREYLNYDYSWPAEAVNPRKEDQIAKATS